MSSAEVGLPEALERAASALARHAEAIRPANGDPFQLAQALDEEAAREVLGWLLAHEPAAGEELASEWAEDPEGTGRIVLGIDLSGLPKTARKSMRRVLHRLRSSGVAVPETPPAAVVAKLPDVDDSVEEARVSPLDPRGARIVYLALDHPSGGVRLFETVVDDLHGVLGFEVYNSGRSRIRKFLREFERAGARRAAPVTPDAARALIARAVAAQPSARPLPRGFNEWRSRLTEPGADPRTPAEIVCAELSHDGVDPGEAFERAKQWIAAGTVGPWPPDPDRAREAAGRIAEAGKGTLVVSQGAREEQVERALAEAIPSLFDEAFRAVTATRFEETAYVLWKTGQEDDARLALCVAASFRSGEPAAAEHPVARALLETLFAPVLEQARSGSTDEAAEEGAA
ncbi:MAG: hypothetical protein ACQGVC_12910 [Myxococcota bacterium]